MINNNNNIIIIINNSSHNTNNYYYHYCVYDMMVMMMMMMIISIRIIIVTSIVMGMLYHKTYNIIILIIIRELARMLRFARTQGTSRARMLIFVCAELRGFVVSANLRNTRLPSYSGKVAVSANLRNSVQNFHKSYAEKYQNPGSRDSVARLIDSSASRPCGLPSASPPWVLPRGSRAPNHIITNNNDNNQNMIVLLISIIVVLINETDININKTNITTSKLIRINKTDSADSGNNISSGLPSGSRAPPPFSGLARTPRRGPILASRSYYYYYYYYYYDDY